MTVWVTVLALAAVSVAMRITAPLLLGERRPERFDRALTFAVPSLLPTGGHGHAGRGARGRAGPAARRRRRGQSSPRRAPLLVTVLAAAVVTAGLRAL